MAHKARVRTVGIAGLSGAGVRKSLQPLSQCPALAKSSVGGICDDYSTMVGASTNQMVCAASLVSLLSMQAISYGDH